MRIYHHINSSFVLMMNIINDWRIYYSIIQAIIELLITPDTHHKFRSEFFSLDHSRHFSSSLEHFSLTCRYYIGDGGGDEHRRMPQQPTKRRKRDEKKLKIFHNLSCWFDGIRASSATSTSSELELQLQCTFLANSSEKNEQVKRSEWTLKIKGCVQREKT